MVLDRGIRVGPPGSFPGIATSSSAMLFLRPKIALFHIKKVVLPSVCVANVFSISVPDLAAAKWRVSRAFALACLVVRFPRGKSGCQGQQQRQRRVGQSDKSMMPVEGHCRLVFTVYHQGISSDLRASGTVERIGQ